MPTKVPGEGPVPCDLMIIGEGPGKDEDRAGRPFVGKSGKELNRYIWHSCQRMRSSYYVTNLVKYRVPDDADPTMEDIKRDEAELVSEIKKVDPAVIATVGRWSTRWLLGNVDMDVVHGIVHRMAHHYRTIVPCIHPAAGLHNTEFQAKIAWDFEQLGKVLRYNEGKSEDPGLRAADDEYPKPDYQDVPYEWGASIDQIAAVDTEGSVKRPWGLSISTKPGVALNFRYVDSAPTVWFTNRVIMHSALHDLPVLRSMGIDIGDDQFDDTMIKAYLLCVEPQGLKALCKRHCGMDMQDYWDLVGAVDREKKLDYLTQVWAWLNNQSSSASTGSSTTVTKRSSTRKTAGKKSAKACRTK